MGRPVKKPQAPAVLVLNGAAATAAGGGGSGDGEERDVLAELAQAEGGSIAIERMPARNDPDQTPEKIGSFPASNFSGLDEVHQMLREVYGGGLFRYRARTTAGHVLGSWVTVKIGKPLAPPAAPPAAAVAPGPARDPIETAAKIAAIVTPLLTALISRPDPRPGNGMSVGEALALSERMGGKQPSLTERIEELQALKGLLRDGDDSKPTTGATLTDLVVATIREGGAMLRESGALRGMLGQQPAAQATAQLQALPAAAAGQGEGIVVDGAAVPPAVAVQASPVPDFALLAATLQRAAAAGHRPQAYAEMVVEQLGEETVQQMLEQPSPVDVVMRIAASHGLDLAASREWLAGLVKAIAELYEEEPNEAPGPKGPEQKPLAVPAG